MGLINGFLSGAAFTSLSLYLTLSLHRQTRYEQSARLNQSLASIHWTTRTLDPKHESTEPTASSDTATNPQHSEPIPSLPSRTDPRVPRSALGTGAAAHESTDDVISRLKANWNHELVSGVRYLQDVNWSNIFARLEDSVASGLGRTLEGSQQGIDAGVSGVQKAVGEASEAARSTSLADLEGSARSLGGSLRAAGREARDAVAPRGKREGY